MAGIPACWGGICSGHVVEDRDQETVELVAAVFDRLAQLESPAENLRQAQLEVISKRRAKSDAAHPFYWAAFTLTGSGQ